MNLGKEIGPGARRYQSARNLSLAQNGIGNSAVLKLRPMCGREGEGITALNLSHAIGRHSVSRYRLSSKENGFPFLIFLPRRGCYAINLAQSADLAAWSRQYTTNKHN